MPKVITKRKLQREERRRQQNNNSLMRWGGLGLFLLVLIGGLVWLFTSSSNTPQTDSSETDKQGCISQKTVEHIPALRLIPSRYLAPL